MKPLRVVNLILLCALLIGGLSAQPASTRTQIAYDCSTATDLPQNECEALVALYTATGGENWYTKTGWLDTTIPCTWYGVTCNTGHVTQLSLLSNNLSGALPPEIGNLTALERLYLWDNVVSALPPEIGNLTALTWLSLENNILSTLPPEIGDLTAVENLFLDDNALTALPPEIGNLPAIRSLSLAGNVLTTLPAEIGNLTTLTELYLGKNTLTTLPPEIGHLTGLHALYLGHNVLTALPREIGDLTTLTELCLNANRLITLPVEFSHLTALRYLYLSDNAFTVLPPEISNLTALTRLYLNDNAFSGAIPELLTVITSLQRFTFYNTAWCVPETGPVPAWLAGIEDVEGTGRICGQASGSLGGTVTYHDSSPAAGVRVNLYQPIVWTEWSLVASTGTLADGTYQIDGLGQDIDYRVEFVDPTHIYAPEYYDNQLALEESTPVTVTLGETRMGIDAVLLPAVVKSATPAVTVTNGDALVYQLLLHTDIDTTLHLYDPLDSHLTWQGFVDLEMDSVTYTGGALTGTLSLLAFTPITIAFAVQVELPPESFVSEYAQFSNTAYYAFPDETLLLGHPSNTQVTIVHNGVAILYLPVVARGF
ncbi:MAG: leucine-rich repeat domain-containing protein [Anaerolineae bacterium]|nr:leucine-rich repeat domain-containing protein [Anaerolineae bacterium]